jgi:hypothetical protein
MMMKYRSVRNGTSNEARVLAWASVVAGRDVINDVMLASFGWDGEIRDEAYDLYYDWTFNGRLPPKPKGVKHGT